MRSVQVTGEDSTVQFLGEVADAHVVVQRLVPGMSRQCKLLEVVDVLVNIQR